METLNSNVSGKGAARITMRERTKLCWLEAILVCFKPAHWSDQVDIWAQCEIHSQIVPDSNWKYFASVLFI